MTTEALRAVIDEHTCEVAGVSYRFRLVWCAKEKYAGRGRRKLLNVECLATSDLPGPDGRARLQLVVWITNVEQVPAMLEDAVIAHLARADVTRHVEPHKLPSHTISQHSLLSKEIH
jgi:hypothetical protein